MSNSNSSVVQNTRSKVQARKGARYYFDQITRNIIPGWNDCADGNFIVLCYHSSRYLRFL